MSKQARAKQRSAVNRTTRTRKTITNDQKPTTLLQEAKHSAAPDDKHTLMAESTPFLVVIYVILPTTAISGLILNYFYLTKGYVGNSLIVAIWVIARGIPTATKRWLGKPIPTIRPAAHVMRFYFILIVTLVPYLIIFSTLYYSLGHKFANQCTNVALTKMSSLYFTATTFSTTGFGDIHAVTTTCQAWVTTQMVSGFVFISVLVTLFVSRLVQLIGNPGLGVALDPSHDD